MVLRMERQEIPELEIIKRELVGGIPPPGIIEKGGLWFKDNRVYLPDRFHKTVLALYHGSVLRRTRGSDKDFPTHQELVLVAKDA